MENSKLAKPFRWDAWIAKKLVSPAHAVMVDSRRVKRLAMHIAAIVPTAGSLRGVDVGCGSGRLTALLAAARSDLSLEGIDIIERNRQFIDVKLFDGKELPLPNKSVDFCILTDVLHHCDDPAGMLRECERVSTRFIVVKDHFSDGAWDAALLRVMDWVGNRGHEVPLPHNYFSRNGWSKLIAELGLSTTTQLDRLDLYPFPFTYIFDSSLHFLALLKVPSASME